MTISALRPPPERSEMRYYEASDEAAPVRRGAPARLLNRRGERLAFFGNEKAQSLGGFARAGVFDAPAAASADRRGNREVGQGGEVHRHQGGLRRGRRGYSITSRYRNFWSPCRGSTDVVSTYHVASVACVPPHCAGVGILINALSVSAAQSMSASLRKRPKCCVAAN